MGNRIYIIIFLFVGLIYSFNFLQQKNVSAQQSQQQGSFELATPTAVPTLPIPTSTQIPTTTTTPRGITPPPNVTNPPASGKQYCVDEAPGSTLIESCDDATRCDVAHGGGGPASSCGSVISWEHKIIETLLGSSNGTYNNRLSDNLSTPIQSSCYVASTYSPYISTFNVIDSYRLAGFTGLDRGTHASAATLTSAWASLAGYTVSTSAVGLTPGDAVLFSNPPHVGIVNTVEVDARGNGDIWFLHTGAAYYLGKLMVANNAVVASSTGDNSVKFGSAQTKGPDATIGKTVCYCDGGSVCYQHIFN